MSKKERAKLFADTEQKIVEIARNSGLFTDKFDVIIRPKPNGVCKLISETTDILKQPLNLGPVGCRLSQFLILVGASTLEDLLQRTVYTDRGLAMKSKTPGSCYIRPTGYGVATANELMNLLKVRGFELNKMSSYAIRELTDLMPIVRI